MLARPRLERGYEVSYVKGRIEEFLGQEWDHSVPSSSRCQALFDRILINNGGGGVSKPRLKEKRDGTPSGFQPGTWRTFSELATRTYAANPAFGHQMYIFWTR